MDQRVSDALRRVEADELPDWLPEDALPPSRELRRERAAALRGAFDLLVVQTIHAFCRRLLLTYPLEAGLHPRLEIDADGQRPGGDRARGARGAASPRLRGGWRSRLRGAGGAGHRSAAARGAAPRAPRRRVSRPLPWSTIRWPPTRVAALGLRARSAVAGFRAATGGCFHAWRASNKTAIAVAELVDADVGTPGAGAVDGRRGARGGGCLDRGALGGRRAQASRGLGEGDVQQDRAGGGRGATRRRSRSLASGWPAACGT